MSSRWRKSMWFTDRQMNFATTPTITPDAGGAGSGAGGPGGATGAGGGGGASQPAGTGGGAAAPAAINWDSAPQHFREGYNKLKSDFEKLQSDYKPWQGLNVKPEEVSAFQTNYQQVYSEMKGIGESLGIEEREIADAIKVHGLLPVLDQLRHEAQQAEAAAQGDEGAISEQDLQARIDAAAEARLNPVIQRENARLVKEANTFVENTITQLATDSFKAAGLDFTGAPAALKDFILTGVTEALKYDDDGMRAIKFDGKAAPVQRAFQVFTAMWDAAYLARRQMEGNVAPAARGQQRPAAQAAAPGKKLTFDEMIDNPDTIRTSAGRPAYST